MDYTALRSELTTDPVSLGYSGLSDQLAADKLNATNTGRTLPRHNVPTTEVLGAIVSSEWPAVASVAESKLQTILGMPFVDASNSNITSLFASVFAAGTTRTNLQALAIETVSRATELGLGPVLPVEVKLARSGAW